MKYEYETRFCASSKEELNRLVGIDDDEYMENLGYERAWSEQNDDGEFVVWRKEVK
jgi:hypothetical protein